jgi:hypothetical protein
MPGPNSPYTRLDANQVLKQSFDESLDRLRVDAQVSASIEGEVQCEIDAADGDNIAISSADGTKKVDVSTIGGTNALNVNVVSITNLATTINTYAEVTALAASSLTTVVSYTATANCRLKKVETSGTNIATYTVVIDSSTVDKKRTYFGNSLNAEFNFAEGLQVNSGQTVYVRVIHERPNVGDFNARIQIEE